MSVGYDAFSNPSTGTGTLTWTHTPVAGTTGGVLVYVIETGTAVDGVTTVTYGGIQLNEVTGSPHLPVNMSESMVVHAFHIGGSNVPNGAQTVTVNVSGTFTRAAGCITWSTATGYETSVFSTTYGIDSASATDPSETITAPTSPTSGFISIGFGSGQGAVAGIDVRAGYTQLYEVDLGAQTAGIHRNNSVAFGNNAVGWTQNSDDAIAIAVCVYETLIPTPPVNQGGTLLLMGVG